MNSILLYFNFCLYLIILLYFYKRKYSTGKFISLEIIAIFSVSAFCSIYYYDSNLYSLISEKKSSDLSLFSLLYLFISFIIYLFPISKYNLNSTIHFPKFGNKDLFSNLFVFLGVLSILPVMENMLSLSSMDASDYADAYYSKGEEDFDSRKQFSFLGRICNGVISWFQYITPIGFYFMIIKRKKWYWIILSFLAMINPVLSSMHQGSRGPLFQLVCILVLNYIIFKNYFSKTLNKKILLFAVVTLFVIIGILVIFTIARADGDNNFALEQIYRYLGEGFVNFSETGWFATLHTDGHSIFNGTGHTFMKDLTEYFDSRDYTGMSTFMKIRMYVYYTVFGDYYLDFGVIGGLFINFLFALLFFKSIVKKCNRVSSVILCNLYCKIGFNGIYCFAYMARLEFVLFTIIIAFLLRHFENLKSNII